MRAVLVRHDARDQARGKLAGPELGIDAAQTPPAAVSLAGPPRSRRGRRGVHHHGAGPPESGEAAWDLRGAVTSKGGPQGVGARPAGAEARGERPAVPERGGGRPALPRPRRRG